jgi:hypothetical protein
MAEIVSSYYDDDGLFYFRITDNENEIDIPYRFKISGNWGEVNLEEFSWSLYLNPYYEYKDRYCDVTRKKTDNRIGWLFPIQIFDSDSLELKGNFEEYLIVAFKILIGRIENINSNKTSISDFFPSDTIVLIANNHNVATDDQFRPSAYRLSLLSFGFYDFSNEIFTVKCEGFSYVYNDHLKIEMGNSNIVPNPNIDNLLKEIQQTNNTLCRFILLYQIVEYLMDVNSDKDLISSIDKYNKKELSKNDLLENVKTLLYDRRRIKDIFSEAKIAKDIINQFEDSYKSLITTCKMSFEVKKYYEHIYDFRNKIVHSYRLIIGEKKLFDETVQAFEQLLIHILMK